FVFRFPRELPGSLGVGKAGRFQTGIPSLLVEGGPCVIEQGVALRLIEGRDQLLRIGCERADLSKTCFWGMAGDSYEVAWFLHFLDPSASFLERAAPSIHGQVPEVEEEDETEVAHGPGWSG